MSVGAQIKALSFSLLFLILDYLKNLRKKFFAHFINSFMDGYNQLNDELKKKHFESLGNVQSKSEPLRGANKFSLVEVGVGSGANFKYLPSNCVMTVVDPNPHFQKLFEENKKKFPEIEVSKFIVAAGEDMHEIPDNSVDVVVVTLVLCSVQSQAAFLSEVKRILVPGGKFYFWEHIGDTQGTLMQRTQVVGDYIWPYIFDGCRIARNSTEEIERSGFSGCNSTKFYVRAPDTAYFFQRWILNYFIGSHVRGVATK
ncbi:unnamed protein product [Notodromas monacha]|uniref:Methyltransferase type 11 domain-containing protein n=1 Tax=Notodromas monacha TaxID=399045 RepID=A0A7R9BSY4_9CRUS|nr:unnamed protein product [Notodromas monacha]CAG0921155.1 unnamed protein product [Notodromas monacha]